MDILIKKALVIDPTSRFNGQTKDILISSGVIKEISDDIASSGKNIKIIEEKGLCASPGWFDTACRFGEPLYEEAETLESGARAAVRGGFTAVALASPEKLPYGYASESRIFHVRTPQSSCEHISGGNGYVESRG